MMTRIYKLLWAIGPIITFSLTCFICGHPLVSVLFWEEQRVVVPPNGERFYTGLAGYIHLSPDLTLSIDRAIYTIPILIGILLAAILGMRFGFALLGALLRGIGWLAKLPFRWLAGIRNPVAVGNDLYKLFQRSDVDDAINDLYKLQQTKNTANPWQFTKASEYEHWAQVQGWKRTQSENGPIKYWDDNGIERVTIKKGSTRAPGSESPHVSLRDANGQRVDPHGNPVLRRSPGNHTPIEWDIP